MPNSRLLARIQHIAERAGFTDFAVAFFDYETTLAFSYQGDRAFHAASTIKAAFLFALFRAVEEGICELSDTLHVRNRFLSVADGSPFRVDGAGDGDSTVHKHIGRTMRIDELARAMIVRSSNLATNLLFDFIGAEFIEKAVREAGFEGMKALRGVEDNLAFERGINNEVTADALVRLYRDLIEEKHVSKEHAAQMLEIFLAQEFKTMIPARLPEGARVAHKTGEISTCAHDAGIVFLPGRKPYVLAILTETPPEQNARNSQIAAMSEAICDYLVRQDD